jgi:hypothetical protein
VIGDDGEEWGLTDQNFPRRTLLSVDLHDVAPVNAPAYLDTSTAIRSLARHMDADVAEVRKLADEGELRKFFMRTDGRQAPPARRPSSVRLPGWRSSAARRVRSVGS